MRIKELNLIAFGPFEDYVLKFAGGNRFNLVYGLNEAGKSTILRAIQDFFYEIPTRSPDSYLFPANKMRIQALLETAAGRKYNLIRRRGRKNTLLNEEGTPTDENTLKQYLGAIDRDAFALMFGMDHRSLRRGGEDLLRGKGALGEALFEAASGIGGMRELLRELDKEAGDLFKPSGSRPPVNVNLREYREIKKKVKDLSLSPRRWSELEESYLQQKEEVAQLKEKEQEITRRKNRLERLTDTLPLVARRERILEEIDRLGDLPVLPAEFKDNHLELIRQRDGAIREQERALAEKEDRESELRGIVVPDELLKQEQVIAALQQRLDTYRSYRRDIPTLEGQIGELSREALALLRRLKPSFTSLDQVETLMLPLTAIEEIKHLAGEQPLLVQRQGADRERVQELERQLAELAVKKENLGAPKDVSELNRVLNKARHKGDLEGDLSDLRLKVETLESKIANEFSALGHWSGTRAQLRQQPLPLMETVRSFEERFKKKRDELNQIGRSTAAEENDLESYRRQLVSEKLTGEITETMLEEARLHRQRGWHLVRRAWFEGGADEQEEGDYCAGRPLYLAYEMSVLGADEIADRLRHEAVRAGRASLLEAEVNKCREKLAELAAAGEGAAEKKEALEQEWNELWRECAITPLTPPEMLSWLSRCQEVRSDLEQLDELNSKKAELARLINAHREEIGGELLRLAEPAVQEGASLEALIERAQELSEKYQDRARELQSTLEASEKVAGELADARQKEADSEKALAEWREKWTDALKPAGLAELSTATAVLSYLATLEKLSQSRDELARNQANLDKMKEYSGDFEDRLEALLLELDPELLEQPADYAASRLQERVIRAQRDRDQQKNLRKQIEQAEKTHRISREMLEETARRLKALQQQARCREETEIAEVIAKVEQLAELKKDLSALEEQLFSRGGGLSLEAIVEETGGVDGDALPGLLKEVAEELGENRREQDELNRTFGATRSEYEEKVEGASLEALEAEEEAQGVLAELSVQTEQYLRLRLASIVLRRSIDRYREENQNPVIRAAGKLFARLTGGSFSGLEVGFDDKDNPVLLGARKTEEHVPVDGMSDGTLDQLYLSLRLASLEKYLEQNEPLPFILDDLLVNFDDIRSAETLQVLGEFAQKTQVLFFTHHQSLVELAQKVIPQSEMISLS